MSDVDARDDLARIIRDHHPVFTGHRWVCSSEQSLTLLEDFDDDEDVEWLDLDRHTADAILEAGWRPPARVIDSVEEVRDLPTDSVLVGWLWTEVYMVARPANGVPGRLYHGNREVNIASRLDQNGPFILLREGGHE